MHEPQARIAYVVSMHCGMEKWTRDEVDGLTADGKLQIAIFSLRTAPGPYMPNPTWPFYPLRKRRLPLAALRALWRRPRQTLRLAFESLPTRSLGDLAVALEFVEEMARQRVELVHAVFGDHKLFVAYYCARLLNLPLSVALYGYDLRFNPNWRMFRHAIRGCDTIIVNCDFNKGLLEKAAGAEASRRAQVIRHSAELPPTAQARKVKLLMVGRFEERKGHDLLMSALQSLDCRDQLEVLIAGMPGPVDVARLVREAGLEDTVKVLGTVSDETLRLLFRECDIFCLPSRTDRFGVSEGLPVALIEAMSYGKPVTASRIAGTPELVEEILFEENDVHGLADAIRALVTQPDLRRRLGERGREIVRERYSRRNIDTTGEVLLAALKRDRA